MVIHPLESVTVHVYVPTGNPVAVALVPPLGAQLYVYGPVPPVAFTVALPVLPPKHCSFISLDVTVGAPMLLTEAITWWLHPLASVTVQV